ncbi:filamentous hemagglutinin N-terminal domain-containing protein [Salmonella enterica]|nr:filamentous hemagglutinin N-terminal domain-containing protein [Salmonella enterica]
MKTCQGAPLRRALTLLFTGALFIPVGADAAPAKADPLAQEAARQFQQQEQQQKARDEALTPEAPDIRLSEDASSPSHLVFPEEKPCFAINHVTLTGQEAVPRWVPRTRLANQAVGHCVGVKGINLLMSSLQNRLINHGWVTSRVLAPQQDLSSGELQLHIVPGTVREVRLTPSSSSRVSLYSTMPAHRGNLLDVRDIEQGLENLQRLPTVAARMALHPGDAPGESDILIERTQSRFWRVGAWVDDTGTESTGRYQGGVMLALDNPTSLSDLFYVTANPWLAKQEARIILNEVNSRNPSQLNGFIEVAGRRAEVVIANPAGITCAGCGFINASRSTLAAGQVLMENGQLKGFDVNGGRINIEGKGLNAGDTDYTALIARAVTVNGKIHARELTVTAGANVTDARGHVTSIKPAADEGKPAFALDVAALGGMYANKITLVGTEKGLGARNAGELGAGAGELTLTVDGKLDNRGQLQSQGNLQIASQGDMDNPGNLVAGKEISLSATGALRNEGLIRAGGNAILTAGRIESTSGSHLAAGVDAQGGITPPGNLVLTATGELKAQGQNLAQNLLAARGSRVDMGGSQTTAGTVALTATREDVRTAGAVIRAEGARIQAATGFSNDDGQLSAGTLSLQAQSIDNNRGLLRQENAQDLTLDSGVIRNN